MAHRVRVPCYFSGMNDDLKNLFGFHRAGLLRWLGLMSGIAFLCYIAVECCRDYFLFPQ
jgi:hypothetical protein